MSYSACNFTWYKMVPMKIGKQQFYNFYMKFMMWLDYARSKFPIPCLREGRKKIWIFTTDFDFSTNSLWISLHSTNLESMNS